MSKKSSMVWLMNELDESFAKLLGRQATDSERQNLYRVRDALGLKNNDALWLVLMVQEHYKSQYEKFPQAIAKAAEKTLNDFRAAADAVAKASAEAAMADLAQAVAVTAREVAHDVAGKQKIQWILGSIVVAALTFASFGWYMHSAGQEAGYSAGYGVGYAEAKDEKAAAAWANTPEGKMAYRLAQAGSIGSLSRCDQPGWRVEKGFCYGMPAPDKATYGWRLP